MDEVIRLIFHLMYFAFWIDEFFGFEHANKNIFDILAVTVDAEIIEVNDLILKNVQFEPFNSKSLEHIFRSRPDIYVGVPIEIIVSGLDVNDTDLNDFVEFSASCRRSPFPAIVTDAECTSLSTTLTTGSGTNFMSTAPIDDAEISTSSVPFTEVTLQVRITKTCG